MSVAYVDLTNLARNFAAATGQPFTAAAEQLLNSYAAQTVSIAQSMAPVKTGRLRETITAHKTGPLTAVIGPQVPYGAYQEFGTATRGEFGSAVYEIRPKRPGGWLRFEVDGKVVFAKVVHHPGIAPRPYMRPALERIVTPFGQSLAELGGTFIVYGPHQPETRDVSAT